jgi:hypothetical protein
MKVGAGAWLALTAFVYVALVGPTFLAAPAPRVLIVAAPNGERRITLPATALVIRAMGPYGTTTVIAEGLHARIMASPCPNRICVNRGWLTAPGDTAICIPNRVAVRLE